MSKRALKKMISEMDKTSLEEQLVELYERIPEVKTYYDFIFNPKEDKMVGEAKIKISNEYFPTRRKRPRKRRSIAQKYIKHFKTLGMNPNLLIDVMLYNIEIAQTYTDGQTSQPDAFYKSILVSFKEAIQFSVYYHLIESVGNRVEAIVTLAEQQDWPNAALFDEVADDM
jgi:hypothetical protein